MKITIVLTSILTLFFFGCSSDSKKNQFEENEDISLECIQNNGLSTDIDFYISSIDDALAFVENPYKELLGNVYVSKMEDISFLSCVEKINNLFINDCEITNLTGLTNISEISKLKITNMPVLENLTGLNSINKINFLYLGNNDQLINLTGLESLTSLGGIHIIGNENLISFEGLENVDTSIYYEEFPKWEIKDNPALTSIAALNNITGELKSFIDIYKCPSLSELGTFQHVDKSVGLSIIYCPSLTSVSCFPNLLETGDIYLSSSVNVIDFYFPMLKKASFLALRNNDSLNQINLISLTEITDGGNGDYSMVINGNDSLATLSGIDNLEFTDLIVEINGDYSPSENPLENICALRKLYLNQIANGVNNNEIHFRTRCAGNAGYIYSDISEFDAICECD